MKLLDKPKAMEEVTKLKEYIAIVCLCVVVIVFGALWNSQRIENNMLLDQQAITAFIYKIENPGTALILKHLEENATITTQIKAIDKNIEQAVKIQKSTKKPDLKKVHDEIKKTDINGIADEFNKLGYPVSVTSK